MNKIVKRLPKNVIYCYTDIFGAKIYRSKLRTYTVYRGVIVSHSKLDDDENRKF